MNRINRLLLLLLLCLASLAMMGCARQTAVPAVDSAETTPPPSIEESITEMTESFTDATAPPVENSGWIPQIEQIIGAFFVLVTGLVVLRFVLATLARIAERNPKRRLTINRLIPIANVVGWTLIIYIAVSILAPPLQTILTLGASLAIALGFALQDILRNIFGGFVILLDRPFQMGDKIQVGDNYGEVVQIGIRSTRIVTPDDNLVTIPNGDMMNAAISNANAGASNALIVAEFYLPLDIDIQQTKRIAFRAAAVSRYVYLNKPIAVILSNQVHMGRPMLKMRLKAYVLDVRYEFPFSSEMTEIVVHDLLEAGLITAEQVNIIAPLPNPQTV